MTTTEKETSVAQAELQKQACDEIAAAASGVESLGLNSTSVSHKKEEDDGDDFHIPQRFTKSGRKRAVPFPVKLMKVLSNKQFEKTITWTPSGKSFTIVNSKEFVATILPDHFKSAKYSSFTRKLNRWGFMRHYRGMEAGAYYHQDFQRDRLDLVEKMTCYKGETQAKTSSSLKKELPKPSTEVSLPTQPVQQATPRVLPAPLPQPQSILAQLQKQQQQIKVPEMTAAERLNAAIEAEVTRRLKERIQVATVSQQALAVMQQLAPAPQVAAPARQWSLAAGSLQNHFRKAQLQQIELQKQRLGFSPVCLAALRGTSAAQGLDSLPRTNIQGAKTA